MTMIEKFLGFTRSLPSERLESVEDALAALMESYAADYDFTAAELAEVDRRVAAPQPQFAAPEAITKRFGKPFAA